MRLWTRIAFLGAFAILAGIGCGSRPGFEDDFTALPAPEAPKREATDEQIERSQEQERADRVRMLGELSAEERNLYVTSDEEFDLRGEAPSYRFGVGDRFDIRFVHQPEMNISLSVRPDGASSFDLIGDLPVQGLAPDELARTLEEMYSVYLKDPKVNVVVRDFEGRRFFVVGEVARPGEYPLKTPTSLTQAVATAGSWTDQSNTEEVMVIRMREDGTPFAFQVNLKQIMAGAVGADPFLNDMDVVYVPMGRIASAHNFVSQFFGIIIPPIDAAWKTAILTGYRR